MVSNENVQLNTTHLLLLIMSESIKWLITYTNILCHFTAKVWNLPRIMSGTLHVHWKRYQSHWSGPSTQFTNTKGLQSDKFLRRARLSIPSKSDRTLQRQHNGQYAWKPTRRVQCYHIGAQSSATVGIAHHTVPMFPAFIHYCSVCILNGHHQILPNPTVARAVLTLSRSGSTYLTPKSCGSGLFWTSGAL